MQPIAHLDKGIDIKVVVALATPWLLPYKVGVPEHLEMLRHGRSTQLELAGEVIDRAWTVSKRIEQLATYRIGKCTEDVCGHARHNTSVKGDTSVISDTYALPAQHPVRTAPSLPEATVVADHDKSAGEAGQRRLQLFDEDR